MARTIDVSPIRISIKPLTSGGFAPFGTVICNPLDTDELRRGKLPANAVSANQGSAIKSLNVTSMTNYYDRSSNNKPGVAVMNMFSCLPRKLRLDKSSTLVESQTISFRGDSKRTATYLFDVKVLERHPFTFQTFVPLALDRNDSTTAYLIVVAPTLPSPGDTDAEGPKGSGLPDLNNVKAFMARGDQAVTYAAGTWHAPMVVLGSHRVDFVVSQFANGIADDDCQEVELPAKGEAEGIAVELVLASNVNGVKVAAAVKARL